MKHISDYYNRILTEAFVAKFDKKFELEFTINKSSHAEERQSRHGDDDAHYISDDEILETMRKASERIIEDIINNYINIGDRFIVRDTYTNLNIVCNLYKGMSKDKLRVDVVTVIKTDKFWNTKNNWVVVIK